ncbi:MAG: hypothetical protein ACLFQB_10685 [Chitinispirillaceae bacterium]
MARFLFRIGKRLMISKRKRSVRGEVIFILTHLLLLAGIVFALEIVLILLGVEDMYIPFLHNVLDLIGGLFS